MTVIVNTIWGGRVSQVVDRQITSIEITPKILDSTSTKQCIVRCANALVSLAYTGAAIAHSGWMDTILASCLAHRPLGAAMIQPGAPLLGRPLHVIIHELGVNLNGQLNSLHFEDHARSANLTISIVGWHLGKRRTPLAWELHRDPPQSNKMRYFRLIQHPVGKFFRCTPNWLWGETLGSPGTTVDAQIQNLKNTRGFTHDDVEMYVKDAIQARAKETNTIGNTCIAVQLDPLESDGHVQITFYPDLPSNEPPKFLSPWILTPTIICSPAFSSTVGHTYSKCGRYVQGGFIDAQNLHIRTRLPANTVHHGRPPVILFGTQDRASPTPKW